MKADNIFKSFAPFIVMLIGGALGLTQVQKLRYMSQTETLSEDEMTNKYQKHFEMQIRQDPLIKRILEEDKNLAKQDWVNIRGPPPDSDSRTYQDELRRKMAEEEGTKS